MHENNRLALLIDRTSGLGYILQGTTLALGRNPSSQICLNAASVSWNHALIAQGTDGWYIMDCSSTNGIFMDGKRLPAEQYCRLETGCDLVIADLRMDFTEKYEDLVRYGVLTPEPAEPVLPPPEQPKPVPRSPKPPAGYDPDLPPLWTDPGQSRPPAGSAQPAPQSTRPPVGYDPELPPLWKGPEPSVPSVQPAEPLPEKEEDAPEPEAQSLPEASVEPSQASPEEEPPETPAAVPGAPNEAQEASALSQQEKSEIRTGPELLEPEKAEPSVPEQNMPIPQEAPPASPQALPVPERPELVSWRKAEYIPSRSAPVAPVASAPPVQSVPAEKKHRSKAWIGAAAVAVVLVIVALSAFLTDGFKSKELRAAEKGIASIGEVTLSSGDSIERARADYERLEEHAKARVKNIDVLENAEISYQVLLDKKAAEGFDEQVRSLGEVSLDSGDLLSALYDTYDALADSEKAYVSVLQNLDAAKQRFTELRAEDADNMIAALGEIRLDKEEELRTVRHKIDDLPQEVQALLKNTALLSQKEQDLETLKERTAYEDLLALSSAGEYKDAARSSLVFLRKYPSSGYKNEVESLCMDAYHKLAKELETQRAYEDAKNTLEECLGQKLSVDEGTTAALLEKLMSVIASQRPANGKVFAGNCRGGYGKLIINSGDEDIYVKLESVEDPEKNYLFFYVRANDTVRLNIRDGEYTLKYASGETWYGQDVFFGQGTSYTKADTILSFKTTYSGAYVYFNEQTISLYKVFGGNLGSEPIGQGDF